MKQRKQLIFKLQQPKKFKVTGASYDKVSLKSCYYICSAWFQNNGEDYNRELKKKLKRIKTTVWEQLDRNIFKEDFIVVDTIPEYGGLKGQQYVTFEFTFYTTEAFHQSIVETRLNKITKQIESHFEDDEHFQVSMTKHDMSDSLVNWNPDNYFPGDELSPNEKL
jgi:uncharacterized protein YgfB (UPF0149 family)